VVGWHCPFENAYRITQNDPMRGNKNYTKRKGSNAVD